MAKAAEDAVRLSRWQLALGVIGAGLLLWTLRESRRSANAAIEAAKAATKSADAAAATMRIMRQAERPYVVTRDTRIDSAVSSYDPEFKIRGVHFALENIGRGLAIILGYGITHEVSSDGKQGQESLTVRDQFGGFTLSPGSIWTAQAAFDFFQLTEQEYTEVVTTEGKSVFVYGYIRYADLFGVIRRTSFSYEMFINSNDGSEVLVVSVTNRALWYDYEEEKDENPKPTSGAFAT